MAATRRRAAARAGSRSVRQLVGSTARAACEGQIEVFRGWAERRARMAASSWRSVGVEPALRQRSEQYLMLGQSRSHFLRHWMRRPQVVQGFSGRVGMGDGDVVG